MPYKETYEGLRTCYNVFAIARYLADHGFLTRKYGPHKYTDAYIEYDVKTGNWMEAIECEDDTIDQGYHLEWEIIPEALVVQRVYDELDKFYKEEFPFDMCEQITYLLRAEARNICEVPDYVSDSY